MKTITIQIISMIVMTISLAAASASAQSTNRYRAQVPFDFAVGKDHFKAGSYTIGPANANVDNGAIVISDTNGKNARMVLSLPGFSQWTGGSQTLVFTRHGEQYSLSAMTTRTLSIRFRMPSYEAQLADANVPQAKTVLTMSKE